MDFTTFHEKLASEDLKTFKPTASMLSFLNGKYADKEILGSYRLHDNFAVTYFKQKLWHKLAFFKDDVWIETRVNSLKNKLPDEVFDEIEKELKKSISIIKVESVITAEGDFYYYVIAKISGKKKLMHISKEGTILVNTKYLENLIRLNDEDEDEESGEVDPDSDEDDDIEDIDDIGVIVGMDDDIDDGDDDIPMDEPIDEGDDEDDLD
jgi:hypothetical protein